MPEEQQQEEEFSIHWIQDVLDQVLARDVKEYLISSGKSPSGSIHIGFMRELITSDVIKRKLLDAGKKARTMFVVDDYDPVRSFPRGVTLSLDEWAGVPYSDVPDEYGCCKSYGDHWTNELIDTFPHFGVNPEIVWTSELYESGKMLSEVRTCLKNTEVIRSIMIEYVARDFEEAQHAQYVESMSEWYPASVICPKCGHIQSGKKGSILPNRITHYDSKTDKVTFECTQCGHADTQPLNRLRVKLTWRVDWPAKWHLFKVTCEPAGKDHSVKGGSYDTGLEVSRRVFGWEGPVKVPFEWVQIGGRDMATSEGVVYTPRAWREIAPGEIYRFLMLRTDLQRTINIQPERIPDMVDQYDRFERLFYGLDASDDPSRSEMARLLFPLSEVRPLGGYIPKLSFRAAVLHSQLEGILGHETVLTKCVDVIKKQYGLQQVPPEAVELARVRLMQALRWVQQHGSERDRVEVPETVPKEIRATLTDADRLFLRSFADALRGHHESDEAIQAEVFDRARATGITEKRAFLVLYRVLISSKSGPRLGPFINALGVDWVVKRITSVL
ncbi:MAG: lysine--tRNA ligase [Candidatus Thorarchaeota archaeon]|nr:lysine--tRNA ligase [Candidatus Thorarchaeota archaeon]